MAILKDSITINEEILNRHEKAVIRGIYRASQLSEALNTLIKIEKETENTYQAAALPTTVDSNPQSHINDMKVFLAEQVLLALVSTKVPAKTKTTKEPSKS